MTQLTLGVDKQGNNTFLRKFSDTNYKFRLNTTVETTLAVPTGKTQCIFGIEPGTKVWIGLNATIVAPLNNTPTLTAAEQNPPGFKELASTDVIHFVTNDTTAEVSVTFYE